MRLFVALDIPEDVRSAIGKLIAKLRSVSREPRWVRVEGLHVTLKFIGEVPSEKAESIKAALSGVPPRNSFSIGFRGLGFFPHERRPRVLWAGVQGGPELAALAADVDTSLEPLGIAPETRAFSPHLTLARFDSPRGLDALHTAVQSAASAEFGTTTASEFHLYQSVLKRGGAEYTRLASFPFAGRASE